MARPSALLLLPLLALAGPAFAATVPLDGAYGNGDGCAYAATGETNGSDAFVLLTDEAITTAASYCEFTRVLANRGETTTVIASCQDEGAEAGADVQIDLIKAGKDGYRIAFQDGTKLGPLPKCK